MATGLVFLDNTVLTNFALVGRSDLVLNLWGEACATTPSVMEEYQAGVFSRGLSPDIWNSLPEMPLNAVEQAFADRLPLSLGNGERSCIAVAVHHRGMFACDDAVARREAQRLGLTITGTIGILVMNIRQGKLTAAEGNAIMIDLITQGYRSPITTLDDLL